MKPKILMIGPLMALVQEALAQDFDLLRYWEADDKDALLAAEGAKIKGIATDGHLGASRALMDRLPNLEIIVCQGVGYDAIDLEAARAHGIAVTNTPEVLSNAVAELTLGMMIGLCRRIPQCDQYVRKGHWLKAHYPLTAELTGAQVGILGLGRIGKEIAARCSAFKMQISYHGRTQQADQPYRYYSDLVAMARDVDWLVVIAPGSAETQGLVSREVLEALGPKGCLVNVARGSLVDETALVALLTSGKLGGAALDVFAQEPKVPEALFGLDNVLLLPHVGSATVQTRRAMGQLVIDNLAAHFAGRPLLTPVA
ncbi:2-hydroxyacid dehydrogenase [Limibacillus sp. MBR-115]|jgi:lactate dehydrogenase-like 2-hydroxyacid dehydrogenase|uniref:2-hydroxyacid dehydrogenase n=1 Tax=Limibacillus sp. MBR-115 TaxID=3156465 RepID=UPI0033996CFC